MFDLHCLHLGRVEWLSVRVGGTVPDGRINHTLCCYGRTLYLFGGAFKGVPSHEVYALYTDEHRSLPESNPEPGLQNHGIVIQSTLLQQADPISNREEQWQPWCRQLN